jgi:diketogulonate reductase-like aldo/keto reductase
LLQSIAAEHNSSVSSVVLNWVLSTGAIIIPKSSKEEHVAVNAKILTNEKISLTLTKLEDIAMLDGSIGKPWE